MQFMNSKTSYVSTSVFLAIIAVAVSVISFHKSGEKNALVGNDVLSSVQNTKKMKVCYAVWPPAVIKDSKSGELSGHDIDAMKRIASDIGVTIEYHETTFGNMSTDVATGVCDVGTSLFVKISRAFAVDFSRPLFYAGNSALVRKGDTRFKTLADIDKPGIKVAVATGESGDIYAKEHFKQATIVRIDVESADLSRFMLEVTSGRADIALADSNEIKNFAAAHPDTEDIFASAPFDINPDAFPVALGQQNFLDFINNSLLYMQTSGVWDELEKKYDAHWLHADIQYHLH
jgi:ABC-type amino acid transport substrate-binding protein